MLASSMSRQSKFEKAISSRRFVACPAMLNIQGHFGSSDHLIPLADAKLLFCYAVVLEYIRWYQRYVSLLLLNSNAGRMQKRLRRRMLCKDANKSNKLFLNRIYRSTKFVLRINSSEIFQTKFISRISSGRTECALSTGRLERSKKSFQV